LLSDEYLRAGMGRAARKCVEEKYSWASRMEPLLALCTGLVDQDETGAPLLEPGRNKQMINATASAKAPGGDIR
jgi:hypothetical protein